MGHWFAKQSAYVLNNTVVGGQRWWPKEGGKMKVEMVLNTIASHLKLTGLVIVRSYSPSHYEGGLGTLESRAWGKCSPQPRWPGTNTPI